MTTAVEHRATLERIKEVWNPGMTSPERQAIDHAIGLHDCGWHDAKADPPPTALGWLGVQQSERLLLWVVGHGHAFGKYVPALGWLPEGFGGEGWVVSHWAPLTTPEGVA
jgi:hypothetical protein